MDYRYFRDFSFAHKTSHQKVKKEKKKIFHFSKKKKKKQKQRFDFDKERSTFLEIPLSLPNEAVIILVGTDKGNTFFVNLDEKEGKAFVSDYQISFSSIYDRLSKEEAKERGSIRRAVSWIQVNGEENNQVLLAYENGMVVEWDLKNFSPLFRYENVGKSFSCCCWKYDFKTLFVAYKDGKLEIYQRGKKLPSKTLFGDLSCKTIKQISSCKVGDFDSLFLNGTFFS